MTDIIKGLQVTSAIESLYESIKRLEEVAHNFEALLVSVLREPEATQSKDVVEKQLDGFVPLARQIMENRIHIDMITPPLTGARIKT